MALGLLILAAWLPPLPFLDGSRHYLPLHTVLEFLAIAAALMIFTVGWFSYGHDRGARFQVLACISLATMLITLLHILSYPGMPDLVGPSSVEKAINFWLPAQALNALMMLTVALLPTHVTLTLGWRWLGLAAALAVALAIGVMGLFFMETAPRTFIPGQGLTTFKIAFECAIMAVYAAALLLLLRRWRRNHDPFDVLLALGAWILLLGEFSLTLYATVSDLNNLIGHLFRIWGEGCVFWAVFEQAMYVPHRRLQESESQLARSEEQAHVLLRENQILLDNALVGIFFARDRRVIRINRTGEAILGYAPGELDQCSTEVIYPSHAVFLNLGAHAYPVIETGKTYIEEIELVRKDGSRFWGLLRGLALTPGQPLDGAVWILEDVTAARQSRQVMEESAELYRAIFASRQVVQLLIQPNNGRIVDANVAAAEFYGYSQNDLRQMRIWELNAGYREELMASMESIRISLRPQRLESQHRLADGRIRDVAMHSNALHWQGQSLLLSIILDITQIKATQQALRTSEDRLQRALDGTNEGFWDWNIVTGEVLFSRRWAEMLGYDLAEIEPRISSWEKRVHPGDLPQCQAALQAHFAGETPQYRCEHRVRARKGDWRWILARGKVTARDEKGQPLQMAGTHNDVTSRRCAENALRASESRFRTLVDLLPYGVQEIDLTGRITFANPALNRLYGADCIGHFIWDFLAEDTEREDLCDYLQFLIQQQPPPAPCFTKNRCADGGVIDVQVDWSYRRDERGQVQGFIAIITDITERNQMQEALREQAIHDALTGLFNRRYLDETLPRELHRCQRGGEPLTAAMLDLDHFKQFNDHYGHKAGDVVLQAVGQLLRRSLRASDMACRYGGEELTVVMPGSSLEDARARLEGLRQAVMQMRLRCRDIELPAITMSIGIAAAESEETDATALLGRADAALYRAKAQGRNRIVATQAQ